MCTRMAFSNAKQLRTLAEALCELVQDVNLVVTREGLSVQAIDVSHVCLVSVTLAAADMARFEGADDGTVVLGIHVPNLLCALKLGERKTRSRWKRAVAAIPWRWCSLRPMGPARRAQT